MESNGQEGFQAIFTRLEKHITLLERQMGGIIDQGNHMSIMVQRHEWDIDNIKSGNGNAEKKAQITASALRERPDDQNQTWSNVSSQELPGLSDNEDSLGSTFRGS